jgi:hypothetical protein
MEPAKPDGTPRPGMAALDPGAAALIDGLRREFPDIAPVLIMAPTTRCGSTLLQRAINEAGGAIVYGENFLLVEKMPYLLLGNLATNYSAKTQAVDATLRAFLAGDKGMDASGLLPDYARYRRLLLECFYRVAAFYRDEARASGYARWGMKHQVQDLASLRYFLRLIPTFKGVTLYRDVLAVARSVRARWPENLQTAEQYRELGRLWQGNLRFLRSMRPERMLQVRYEELDGDAREACLARIEAHLGLPLSRRAFEKKVNAHRMDAASGRPADTYVPPADVAPEMARALLQGAQPLYRELGYGEGR